MKNKSWYGRMLAIPRIILILIGAAIAVSTSGCKPPNPPRAACPPLPIRDGAFVEAVIRDGTMRLRLPRYAHTDSTYDCKMLRSFQIEFLWVNGKLVSESLNRHRVPAKGRIPVRVFASQLEDSPEKMAAALAKNNVASWRMQPALKHDKYPLVFYPRFFWAEPGNPPERDPPDTYWGIQNTASPVNGHRFGAYCSIVRADPLDQNSVIHGDFSPNYPDAKCRGGVSVVKHGQFLGARIDVWATGASQIDKIYAAVVAELETYIQGTDHVLYIHRK